MAVLPTPASPISTGLFLVRRERIWITRRISVVAPDDRVELAFTSQLGQVARVFLQRAVAGFGLWVGDPLPAANLLNCFVDTLAGHAGAFQEAGRRGVALAEDRQEDVLGGDIFVFQAVGFFVRQVDNPLDARGDKDLPAPPPPKILALGLVRRM